MLRLQNHRIQFLHDDIASKQTIRNNLEQDLQKSKINETSLIQQKQYEIQQKKELIVQKNALIKNNSELIKNTQSELQNLLRQRNEQYTLSNNKTQEIYNKQCTKTSLENAIKQQQDLIKYYDDLNSDAYNTYCANWRASSARHTNECTDLDNTIINKQKEIKNIEVEKQGFQNQISAQQKTLDTAKAAKNLVTSEQNNKNSKYYHDRHWTTTEKPELVIEQVLKNTRPLFPLFAVQALGLTAVQLAIEKDKIIHHHERVLNTPGNGSPIYSDDLANAEKKITQATKDLTDLTTKLQSNITHCNNRISSLEQQKSSLEVQKTKVAADYHTRNANDVNHYNATVQSYTEAQQPHLNQKNDLEQQLAHITDEINAATQIKITADSQNSTLQTQINNTNKEIATIQNAINQTQSEINALNQQIAISQQEQQKIHNNTLQIQKSIDVLTHEIIDMEQTLAHMNADIGRNETIDSNQIEAIGENNHHDENPDYH